MESRRVPGNMLQSDADATAVIIASTIAALRNGSITWRVRSYIIRRQLTGNVPLLTRFVDLYMKCSASCLSPFVYLSLSISHCIAWIHLQMHHIPNMCI